MDKFISAINKLIVKVSKGDEKALGELYETTSRMLLFMAKKYLYDKSCAEDLVSEVYYKIVKYSANFDDTKNGLNWIYKIVHNEAINFNAENIRRGECGLNEDVSGEDCTEEFLEKILVKEAVEKLAEEEKYIVYLRFWEGLELKEIAKRIDKPLTTTHDYLKRILKKLHGLMK